MFHSGVKTVVDMTLSLLDNGTTTETLVRNANWSGVVIVHGLYWLMVRI